MNHSYETIEQLAKRLCAEAGGNWDKRRKYWVRKVLARLNDFQIIEDMIARLKAKNKVVRSGL